MREVAEGRDLAAVKGLSFRNAAGAIVHNADRPVLEDMDALPFVSPVYRRDLDYAKYFIGYPHLSHTEIFDGVETFYRRFYFRAPKIAAICGEMVRDRQMLVRRLREGVEFFGFLRERARASAAQRAAA